MNRRSSLKTIIIISTGAVFFPSCLQEKGSSLQLKNITINAGEEELLAEIAETIIPGTGTPGAKDISAHLFALMMIDDCYAPGMQEKFINGLKEFGAITKKEFGKIFSQCTRAEKTKLLGSMENKTDLSPDAAVFYNSFKKLTIQAYTSSQYFLSEVQVYKIAPGKFYGCVPIKKAS